MKWIKRILISLLVLVAIVVISIALWLNHSAPEYTGQLSVKGLQEKVDVHFDDYGVPHIYANNKHDLYLTFGYLHAQDRLFQMEMLRRAGSGRLSEIIGRPLLKVDKMFRTLGITEYAKESAAYLETQKGTEMYEEIQAYLQGLNDFIDHGKTPPEFSIIGIEKTHFTVEDLYYITGAMTFSFSQAQKTEPVIDFISTTYGQKYLDDIGLWHDSTESYIRTNKLNKKENEEIEEEEMHDVVLGGISENNGEIHDALLEFAKFMNEIEEALPIAPLEGSNSWVVSGDKTESGSVIFCNDTHIGYLLPQTWYEAHLVAPDFEMYGHFMSGIPYALVGRNRNLSWGLTMLLNDDMDFYREKQSEDDRNAFMYNGTKEPCKILEHTIKIKGEADTIIQVRVTRHGPIINDAFEAMGNADPISMFWTYTHLPNRTVDALYGMNNSNSLEQFEMNLPLVHAPGLNVNYGDKLGNIAWWGCASLIHRREGVNSWTILDGTTNKDEPLGYYPFSMNPKCINPTWGYIYSANDWPQDLYANDGPSDSVTSDTESSELWYPGYYKPQDRANRIRHLLEQKNDWTLDKMKAVMTDHYNVSDVALMNLWLADLNKNKNYIDSVEFRQYDELFRWDGSYDLKNPSPTLYTKMLYHYLHYAMADELGEERFQLFLQTHQVQRTQKHLYSHEDSPWWDIQGTEAVEKRSDIIFMAFCKSVAELKDQLGSNPKIWNWRKVTTLELRHPLGEVALLRPLFNVGPYEVNGGNETILQSGFKLDSTGEYKVTFGSQMRIMVDFANVDSSLNITPCGQSGHLMSAHYRDQAEKYRNMEFREQWMNRERITQFEKMEFIPL